MLELSGSIKLCKEMDYSEAEQKEFLKELYANVSVMDSEQEVLQPPLWKMEKAMF